MRKGLVWFRPLRSSVLNTRANDTRTNCLKSISNGYGHPCRRGYSNPRTLVPKSSTLPFGHRSASFLGNGDKKQNNPNEEKEEEEDEVKEKAKNAGNKKQNNPNEEEEEEEDELKEKAKSAGKFVLKTVLISGAVIGGTALALPAIGFGALGPVAGSLAAGYQSAFLGGTIASGSAFATLQSIGMVGLSAAAKTAIVGSSALVAAATNGKKKKKVKKS